MRGRVLHVIGGSQFGGIIPYVASLVRMVREQGGDAAVLATAPRVVDYFLQRGIEVLPIDGIDRPVNPLRDALGLVRLLRHLNSRPYTVVHTHTSKGGMIGRLAARLAKTPVVLHTTQGYAFADYATDRATRAGFLWAERVATGWCDFIIAVNEADRQRAIDCGIVERDRVVTIPNGVDLAEADAALAAGPLPAGELGLAPGRPVVGTMGRLAPQKGLQYFIDAMPAIRHRVPEAQFLIAGGGELEEELRERARARGVEVVFTGFRSDSYRVLQSIDLFVMPSLWEGMPMMLLEALAARRSVVATRIKGVLDVSAESDALRLIEPASSEAIARAAIALLCDREERERLAARGRARIESHYSDRVMSARTWRVYEWVARAKGVDL